DRGVGVPDPARGAVDRKPPGERHPGSLGPAPPARPAPQGESAGLLPEASGLPQPRRRAGRDHRVPGGASAGARSSEPRGAALEPGFPGSAPPGSGLPPDGPARAAPGDRPPPHARGPRDDRRTGPRDARRPAGERARRGALLLERADAVIVESPTDLGSIDIFSGLAARLVSVPVGGDAAWVSLVKETVARTAPRLIYLMPTFQNPTGAVLPAAGRRALARLSRELQIPIVEDNTLADLSLGAPPPAPIASFDLEAPILTIGSLSKLFWGGLRIGWIRGSEEILARVTRLKIMADLGGSLIGQLVAVRLLAEAERVRAVR